MRLAYKIFFSTALFLVSLSPSFSMDPDERHSPGTPVTRQPFDCRAFVTSFVPKDSTPDYIDNVAKSYNHALTHKNNIQHDGHPIYGGYRIPPLNMVSYDYGCTFPVIPVVQRHLLEFCAQAEKQICMMDIGPGDGPDSIFALLTEKVGDLIAVEKEEAQYNVLKSFVVDTIRDIDPNFPLKAFKPVKNNFLTFKAPAYVGKFDVLNANKLIHFFDPPQTLTFRDRAYSLLKPRGRLFLTCLTPTPGSEIESFMHIQEKNDFPGYVFFQEKTELIKRGMEISRGKSSLLEVRKPSPEEKPAHWFQVYKDNCALTDRVLHYHTAQTLTKILGNNFKILETIITTPETNHGGDYMISIVAEKQ